MNEAERVEFCSSAVEQILEQYPNQTAQAPKPYIEALIRLMVEYPTEVIEGLLHPTRGLATRCKFLPTVADAKEMLEELCRDHGREMELVRLLAAQPPEPDGPPDPEIIQRLNRLRAEISGNVRRLDWNKPSRRRG